MDNSAHIYDRNGEKWGIAHTENESFMVAIKVGDWSLPRYSATIRTPNREEVTLYEHSPIKLAVMLREYRQRVDDNGSWDVPLPGYRVVNDMTFSSGYRTVSIIPAN